MTVRVVLRLVPEPVLKKFVKKKIFFYFLSIRVCAWPHRARCAQRDKKSYGQKKNIFFRFFLFCELIMSS